MPIELYWEDFAVGTVFELGPRTVSREEILQFARSYDPQSFHVDEGAAALSIYGGLIASGWHTCAVVMRMLCDGVLSRSASLGSPGIDSLRWLQPVRPGDTLRLHFSVLEQRASRTKLDRGVVRGAWRVLNQADELVMTMEGISMYLRRHPAAPAG
jgi:acyl dehydratase